MLALSTIGEGGLRYSVAAGATLESAASFDVQVVGTEANVAMTLAQLGRSTGWVSSLPETPLGRRVCDAIAMAGVDTSRVEWASPSRRVGTYYTADGPTPDARVIHYDRDDTAFSHIGADAVDWPYVLDASWLHLTGLTVALSPAVRSVIERALDEAAGAAVPVSFDVNYRSQQWSPSAAAAVLRPMVERAALLFCAERDARMVFELAGSRREVLAGLAALSGASHVVMSTGGHGAMAWQAGEVLEAPANPVAIVDRPGAGDALAAGVLHGLLSDDFSRGLDLGVGLAGIVLGQASEYVAWTERTRRRLESMPRAWAALAHLGAPTPDLDDALHDGTGNGS